MPILPAQHEPETAARKVSAANSRVWRILGIVFVALGLVGVFLPIVPTSPFLIVAVGCYARGDPVAREKLLSHPRFGPPLRAWFDHGVVSRRAKVFAIVSMAVGAAFGIWISGMGRTAAIVVIFVLGVTAVWLALRPERPRAR